MKNIIYKSEVELINLKLNTNYDTENLKWFEYLDTFLNIRYCHLSSGIYVGQMNKAYHSKNLKNIEVYNFLRNCTSQIEANTYLSDKFRRVVYYRGEK